MELIMSSAKNTEVIDQNAVRRAVKAKQQIQRGSRGPKPLPHIGRIQENKIRTGIIPAMIHLYDPNPASQAELQALTARVLLTQQSGFSATKLSGKVALWTLEAFGNEAKAWDSDTEPLPCPAGLFCGATERMMERLTERERTSTDLKRIVEHGMKQARGVLLNAGRRMHGREYTLEDQPIQLAS